VNSNDLSKEKQFIHDISNKMTIIQGELDYIKSKKDILSKDEILNAIEDLTSESTKLNELIAQRKKELSS